MMDLYFLVRERLQTAVPIFEWFVDESSEKQDQGILTYWLPVNEISMFIDKIVYGSGLKLSSVLYLEALDEFIFKEGLTSFIHF